MKYLLTISLWCYSLGIQAQHTNTVKAMNASDDNGVIEIRSYNLKPGTRDDFHKIVVTRAMPMLKRWKMNVLGHGPSLHDENSYYMMRTFNSLADRKQQEDAFYGSSEWKEGPQDSILSRILNYTTIVISRNATSFVIEKEEVQDKQLQGSDKEQLSKLNAQFIKNFLDQNVTNHNEIIHKDFVAIESDGTIVTRDTYMKNWATDFDNSGYTSFSYADEFIRVFGNMALVRAKTIYTRNVNGKSVQGSTIYTDTYIKENGRWWCVQIQITPVIQTR